MKFGLYYNYEISGGKWPKAYAYSLEEVALAEKNGFDIVMVAEHHFQEFGITPSPITACAALGAATKTMRVGSGVVLLPLHNPIRVAEDATIVDNFSQGRFVLGLGLGWNKDEYAKFGIDWNKRKSRMDEGVDVISQLFKNEYVTYKGTNFAFDNVRLMPRPAHDVPIWLAGINPPAVRRAGRRGFVWMQPPVLPMKLLKQRIELYKNELKQSTGKDYTDMERPLRRDGFVDYDSSVATEYTRESEDEHYRYYLKEGLELLDEEGKTVKLSDLEDLWNILKGRYIMGNPDEFIGQVEKYEKETGASEIILKFHGMDPDDYHPKVMKAIEVMGKKVIPYFKDRGS